MSKLFPRGGLKAPAVVSRRLLNSPSTRKELLPFLPDNLFNVKPIFTMPRTANLKDRLPILGSGLSRRDVEQILKDLEEESS